MKLVPQTIEVIARAQGRGPEQIVLTPSGLMCAALWHHEPIEAELIEPAVNILVYQISGTHVVERREAGRVTGSGAAPRGLTLIRAGSSTEWSIRGSAQVLHVYFGNDLLARYAQQHELPESSIDLPAFFNESDPWLEGAYQMLLAEGRELALTGAPIESLLLDELRSALARRLLMRFSPEAQFERISSIPRRWHGGLSPVALRRVTEKIRRELDRPLAIAELAALVSLSDDHFIRAFRESTGQTPYQFLICQRLLHSQFLLREPCRMSIGAVARACGFSSGAHFSSTFRRSTGVSPAGFRGRNK